MGVFVVDKSVGPDGRETKTRRWLPGALHDKLKKLFVAGKLTVHATEDGNQFVWKASSGKRRRVYIRPSIPGIDVSVPAPVRDEVLRTQTPPPPTSEAHANVVVNIQQDPKPTQSPGSIYAAQMAMMGGMYKIEAVRASERIESANKIADALRAASAAKNDAPIAAPAQIAVTQPQSVAAEPLPVSAVSAEDYVDDASPEEYNDLSIERLLESLRNEITTNRTAYMDRIALSIFHVQAATAVRNEHIQAALRGRAAEAEDLGKQVFAYAKKINYPDCKTRITKHQAKLIAAAYVAER